MKAILSALALAILAGCHHCKKTVCESCPTKPVAECSPIETKAETIQVTAPRPKVVVNVPAPEVQYLQAPAAASSMPAAIAAAPTMAAPVMAAPVAPVAVPVQLAAQVQPQQLAYAYPQQLAAAALVQRYRFGLALDRWNLPLPILRPIAVPADPPVQQPTLLMQPGSIPQAPAAAYILQQPPTPAYAYPAPPPAAAQQPPPMAAAARPASSAEYCESLDRLIKALTEARAAQCPIPPAR